MKKILVIIVLFSVGITSAQFEDIFSSDSDAYKYLKEYTAPAFKGFMYASAAGWSTSAKPLKPFRFSLDIGASGAMIPTKAESFTFNDSDYQYMKILSGPNEVPTVMGGETNTRFQIVIPINSNTEQKVMEFDAASGINSDLPLNSVPAPNIQFSMGLPLGTEVTLRYLPKIASDGAYVGILGGGVKHSISQYIPRGKDENGKKKKRNFNLSALAAYQNISTGYDYSNNDKAVTLNLQTLSLQANASMDYKFLTVYSSVGYIKGFTDLSVKGTYDYTYDVQTNNGTHIRFENVQIIDPLDINYNIDGYNATLGLRLNFIFLRIFADYTIQEYPVAHVGLGIKF